MRPDEFVSFLQARRASAILRTTNADAAKPALEAALDGGFEVIDYPSVYYSYFTTGEHAKAGQSHNVTKDARSFVHINTLNSRYVTASDGRVVNFLLSSGYDAIDSYIEGVEKGQGVDEVYFLGHRLAAPKFWGNQVLLSAGGIGCLTNL